MNLINTSSKISTVKVPPAPATRAKNVTPAGQFKINMKTSISTVKDPASRKRIPPVRAIAIRILTLFWPIAIRFQVFARRNIN